MINCPTPSSDPCAITINPRTLALCDNTQITPAGVNGPLVAKLPVVLAETEIQIDVEADIKMLEPFYEIKRITKDVFLTQCKLIPGTGTGTPGTGKLFISGYVRKNFQYSKAECVNTGVVNGALRDYSIDVPYECVTEVNFTRAPQFQFSPNEEQLEFLKECNQCDCKDTLIGKSSCENIVRQTILFNEKPYCELVSARVFEYDIHKCPTAIDRDFPETVQYNALTEKMVVYLTLKVLQLQQVNIDC